MYTKPKPRMVLRKKRDFGETINAVFEFINLNQRDFYRTLVLVVCPLAIIGGVFAGFISFAPEDFIANQRNPTAFFEMFLTGPFWGSIFSAFVGYNLVITACNVYMKLYVNKEEDLSVAHVWQEMKKHILSIFGLQLVCGALILITYVVLVFVVAMLGAIFFPLAIVGFFGILFLMCYMIVCLFMVYSVCIIEDKGVFESISRSFVLVKNHFWSTFGLFLVMFLISLVINLLFSIPIYALESVTAMHILENDSLLYDIAKIGGNVLASVGSYLVLPVLMLTPAFQLYNLVEHKESTGLLARIEGFGIREELKDEETY